MTMQSDASPESSLIYGKQVRLVPVELAVDIGLPEAMIVQQICYWIKIASENYPVREIDGTSWVRITERDLAEQFPFWCLGVIQRALKHLRAWSLVHTAVFNGSKWDKGFWYAIDHERVEHHEDIQPPKRVAPHQRAHDSTIESSRLHDGVIDGSMTGSKSDSMTESTPDSMVESSLIKIKKTPEDLREESVPGSAGTPLSEIGEGSAGEEETEEFISPSNPPETENKPRSLSARPHLPPPVLTATYRCECCPKTLTAAPRDLARTSWRQPAQTCYPGDVVDSLCPDCQKTQAWQKGDRVTWLAEARGGYGFVTPAAGVVRSVSAQRVQVAVIEHGVVVVKSVKPEKLKARDQPFEREAELESAEAPMQPHVALIYAWWEALPDSIRPPGDPPIEPNAKTATTMHRAGFTPERVTAFVTETYPTYRVWAQKHDGPGLMGLNHVLKHLKAWEDKTGKGAGREMTDEEQRAYWGGK